MPKDFSFKLFVDDLAALVTQLGHTPVVAVGHSLGGAIVSGLAVEHPDLVEAVIPVDPAYGFDGTFLIPFNERRTRMASVSECHTAVMELTEISHTLATPAFLRLWLLRRIEGMSPDAINKTYSALADAPEGIFTRSTAGTYLEKRSCPVLSIHSVPNHSEWDQTTFQHPYSRTVEFEGSGHWIHIERPLELASVAIPWIDGLVRE
jgi:pimeloyl-ACP methyl ester carboxylesterase